MISDTRQNVKTMSLTESRTDEVNVAIIVGKVENYIPALGGGGQVIAHRVVFTGQSFGADDSPWNDIEIVRDARNDESTLALSSAADQAYATLGAKESFIVTPLQSSTLQYGRDYSFGDKVLVNFEGKTRIKKVVGVSINSGGDSSGDASSMGESLAIELSDVDAPPNLIDAFHNISSRIDTLEHQGNL
jgi:hypothetical protein